MRAQGPLGPVKTLLVELTVTDGTFRERNVALDAVMDRIEGFERRPVLRVLDRLCRDGDLRLESEGTVDEQKPGPKLRNPTWRVIKDLRLRRDNQVKKRVTCRDKIWNTLRGLRPRATTYSELTRLTGCDARTVRNSIEVLEKGGFVKAKGKIGREKAWILTKDTGPRRPETSEEPRGRS